MGVDFGRRRVQVERMGVQTAVACAAGAAVAVGVYYYATTQSTNGMQIKLSASQRAKKKAKKEEEADDSKQRVNVFFGSQTGTAEEFSKIIAQDGKDAGLNVQVFDLERFDAAMFANSNSLFLVATYGEGEPTDNAKPFFEWLTTQADGDAFKGMRYAVFGLGNTQYEHYNSFGKDLDVKFSEFGASRFLELGLGNDDDDIRRDFEQWTSKLWTTLREQLGLEQSGEAWVKNGVEYHLKYTAFGSQAAAMAAGATPCSNTLETSNRIIDLPVTVNRELYQGGDRSCRHVELDLRGQTVTYETGDHVGIYGNNDSESVETLAKRCNVDLDEWFTLADENGESPFPCPCTVRDALTKYIDINGVPRKGLIAALSEFASDDKEKQQLVKLTHTEAHAEYHAYVVEASRNVLDLLHDFPSVNIPLANLLEMLPRLQPRYYSISSGSATTPESVHVTAIVVDKDLGDGRRFKGVCTNYLKDLTDGSLVRSFIRRTTFKLPADPSVPVIMIGAGTGFAPLRGMCIDLDTRRKGGATLGDNILFFGCRRQDEDFMYAGEMDGWVQAKTLKHLFLAFSRDPDSFTGKVYVQDKLNDNASKILTALDNGAFLYVCGATNMAREIKKVAVPALLSPSRAL